MKGKFITFEGPDGAGKSTHLRHAVAQLQEAGYAVRVTREPGGCPISEEIRRLLLDPNHAEMSPVTEALLYAASRAQHVEEVIRPALERGEAVVCDRYLDSSLAYQGHGRGLGEAWVRSINERAVAGCLPDLTILLMLPPEASRARLEAAGRTLDRLEREKLDFHTRVWTGFQKVAERQPERFLVLDVQDDIATNAEKLQHALAERLAAWR